MLQHSGSTSIITMFYINFSIKVLNLSRRQNSMKLSGVDRPTFRELRPHLQGVLMVWLHQ